MDEHPESRHEQANAPPTESTESSAEADSTDIPAELSFDALSDAFAQVLRDRESRSDHPQDDSPHQGDDPSRDRTTDDPSAEASVDDSASNEPGEEVAAKDDECRDARSDSESAGAGAASSVLPWETDETDPDDEAADISPKTILEAMLFVGGPGHEPLSAERAAAVMRGVEPDEIADIAAELNASYQENGCPYEVAASAGGYRLQLREDFAPLRSRLLGRTREARLSQAAVDVLAIVAYQQPISSDEVSRIRSRPSSHVLSQLVRRRLLQIEADPTTPRRRVYKTTERFLKLFNLRSLNDLPQSEDVDRH